MQSTVRDLIYILSELAGYLTKENEISQNYLDMIISFVSSRAVLYGSAQGKNFFGSNANKNEQLLLFGSKSISELLIKLGNVTPNQIEKIFEMFLHM